MENKIPAAIVALTPFLEAMLSFGGGGGAKKKNKIRKKAEKRRK